jgi:hypothetical protein
MCSYFFCADLQVAASGLLLQLTYGAALHLQTLVTPSLARPPTLRPVTAAAVHTPASLSLCRSKACMLIRKRTGRRIYKALILAPYSLCLLLRCACIEPPAAVWPERCQDDRDLAYTALCALRDGVHITGSANADGSGGRRCVIVACAGYAYHCSQKIYNMVKVRASFCPARESVSRERCVFFSRRLGIALRSFGIRIHPFS